MVFSTIAKDITIRKAGLNYGIPRITFQSCIKGHLSYQKGVQNIQKIVSIQEKVLIEWILVQEALGINPIYRQIQEIGETLFEVKGNKPIFGKQWIYNFLFKNFEI